MTGAQMTMSEDMKINLIQSPITSYFSIMHESRGDDTQDNLKHPE